MFWLDRQSEEIETVQTDTGKSSLYGFSIRKNRKIRDIEDILRDI